MITPKYSFKVSLATAHNRLAKRWGNREWTWGELLNRCAQTKRTSETLREYALMSRDEQSAIKDVGGFVGGYLNGGARKTMAVKYRSVVTLDIDHATEGVDVWDDFTINYGCAAMLYSTHKHTPEAPRLRLVIPADRAMTPEEYEPVCRYWAAQLGIEMFDQTTYQTARLMYWPSSSKDGVYIFEWQDGKPFSVDEVLGWYDDYRDCSQWPMSVREREVMRHSLRKAGDPTEKQGMIGAFCRTYSIEDAIETFLSEVYVPTAIEGRYTYVEGSMAGGLVTYEGKWAYSHHETDPASLKLCNAFDLVRIHRFGAQDEGKEPSDITRLPSYKAMTQMASADPRVKTLLITERRDAASDFAQAIASRVDEEDDEAQSKEADEAQPREEDTEWLQALDVDSHGMPRNTIANFETILENDPAMKGHLYKDLLRGAIGVKGGLPWDENAKTWSNSDESNLRAWMERYYHMQGKEKLRDAVEVVVTRRKEHPIRDYFKGLKWDGTPRLERLIIDYVGAEDDELTRTLTRIHFTAAVARIMEPGCKYDYCPILAGPQGVGKSTLLAIMGGDYYKDGLTSMEGKEGAEQVRGAHLIEIGELDAMKRSEMSAVKQFITARVDEYRPAYAVHKEHIPRQCVFTGTTNEQFILKDATGNRRFPIIKINPELRKHGAHWFEDLKENRDQIWAEACHYYKEGQKLYLPDELEALARERQQEYNDNADDPLPEMVANFLELRLTKDWEQMSLYQRRTYYHERNHINAKAEVLRDKVCAAEFICEYMGKDMADKEYKYLARKVGSILTDLGWQRGGPSRHAQKLYGVQKAFTAPEGWGKIDEDDEDL